MMGVIALPIITADCHAQTPASQPGEAGERGVDLWQSASQGPAQEVPALKVPADPYGKGSWSIQTYASATLGEDSGALYLGHAGAGYFIFEGFSVNFEAVFGATRASEEADDAGGVFPAAGFDLLARWHLIRTDNWTFYIEGGAGALQFSESFPSNGTHFNFTPQAGLGVTIKLADHIQLMLGGRWHHISNANVFGTHRNPGYDGVMVYGGLSIPF